MRGTFVLLISFVFLSCLGPRWIARPVPEADFSRCNDFGEMPQMVAVPGFPSVWQVMYSCDEYPREKTAIALQTFRRSWEEVFGTTAAVDAVFADLLITWQGPSAEDYAAYSTDGTYHTNVSLRGVTLSDSMIIVFQSAGGFDHHERICESALAHELIHAVIWKINGEHGDPDHLGKEFPGWTPDHGMVIQKTNDYLCVLGI
tara:strand:+ start:435 stop:1040 length:606 start_codon:yes stop_codon:yes gene_type:complete